MAKKKLIPDELQQIIDEVREKEYKEDIQEIRELVQQSRIDRANSLTYWDVRKEDKYEVEEEKQSEENVELDTPVLDPISELPLITEVETEPVEDIFVLVIGRFMLELLLTG